MLTALIATFKVNTTVTITIPLTKGKLTIFPKFLIPHFVSFTTIKPNPTVKTNILENTAKSFLFCKKPSGGLICNTCLTRRDGGLL